MKKTITIKDIAQELGIHHTTVSRALREIKSVKKETRDKIWRKAHEMGYRPNRLARDFRNNRSNTIGVLVPEFQFHFFSKFISDFSKEATKSGFSVMVFQSDGKLKIEKEIIESLISYRVSGVIASISKEAVNGEHFELLENVGIRYVFFDRVPEDVRVSHVLLDNYQGAYDAVSLLIRKGRKRIAFLSTPDKISVFNDRFKGYTKALEDNNLPVKDELIVREGLLMEDGFSATQKLLKLSERPDAILAVRDEVSIGAIKCLKKAGLRVPEDVSVIGFDNDPSGIASEPELTTVNQSISKMAATTFELLLKQIGSKTFSFEKRVLKAEIVVRGSS
jgi:DNA-binding LacI/PurR family transcriptional regulator